MPTFDTRTALIVVDVQNDFAHPDGALAVDGASAVIAYANQAIHEAGAAGALIVCTQDWHPPHTPHFEQDGGLWPVHCVEDSWGAEFHDDLQISDGSRAARLIVRKGVDGSDGYSGFTTRDPQSGAPTSTELERLLRDAAIQRCVVIGLATDYCVKETALDAARLGFAVSVPSRGIAAVNLEAGDGKRALDQLSAAGVVVER